ncbi:hypothetical protein [Paenarthrobacter sp. NPDC090522]|uniref:hypothetical protein n=1 Tax=Paenarthrobacter sp. NPDC090522 TaxID=3364383 RepID=UPI00381A22AC
MAVEPQPTEGDEPADDLVKIETTPRTYRLTARAMKLIDLAVNDQRRKGRRANKSSVLEDALIETYGHLDQGKK